jgi:NAD(P)-dependent dehydrogenase (short-subunit alcohol dehydrogenase family)
MPRAQRQNPGGLPVTVIVGATSKWQANGANTVFAHGQRMGDDWVPVGARWGLGGALAQKFAGEGHFVVLTTRALANAADLADAIEAMDGRCMTVELDVGSEDSIDAAFDSVRAKAGEPEVLIYNAGYMAGRELPPDQELLEFFPVDLFDIALATACRGPFLIARQVLPAMRTAGRGALFFSNNAYSLRGRKRMTGESLYYPRTMMRAFAQALTEEYSGFGVHVANIVVDGFIDSPGTRALQRFKDEPELLMDPLGVADAVYYLYAQDRSCWTHELQLTPAASTPSF